MQIIIMNLAGKYNTGDFVVLEGQIRTGVIEMS
jgi:hypothetical protein